MSTTLPDQTEGVPLEPSADDQAAPHPTAAPPAEEEVEERPAPPIGRGPRVASADRADVLLQLRLIGLAGLLIMVPAHFQFQRQELTLSSAIAVLVGVAIWIWVVLERRPEADLAGAELSPAATLQGVRVVLLALAGAATVLTWVRTGENLYTSGNVVPWLLACGLWLAAWWPWAPSSTPLSDEERMRRLQTVLLLVAITAVGAFFRFYRLADTPWEPTSDHAEKLLDVNDLVEGKRPLFLERNTGREPLQFYFTFALIKLFNLGTSYETLKFGTSLIDVMAVPAVYLMARELGGRRVGLLAAALYAVAQWPTTIARVGLRFPYGPLPTALVLWSLLRYMRSGDRRDALICGVVCGVGLYGYSPFRVSTLAVPIALGLMLAFDRRWRGRRHVIVGHGLLLGATAAVVFLPLLHFMFARPDLFWERAASRAIGEPGSEIDPQQVSLFSIFLKNNLNALLAFNWKGDTTIVNFITNAPFLDPLTGSALLAGLVIVIYQIVRHRSLRYAMLVLVIPFLFLTSTLSLAFPIENPSINRMGPVAPVIFTFAALPLALLGEQIVRLRRADWSLPLRRPTALSAGAGLIMAGMLLYATRQNYQRFFVEFDNYYKNSSLNLHGVVKVLRGAIGMGVDKDHAYHVPYAFWLDSRNIGINLGDFRWHESHVVGEDPNFPVPADGKPLMFVLHRDDAARRDLLLARWPSAIVSMVPSDYPGHEFMTVYVPAGAAEERPPAQVQIGGEIVGIRHTQIDMGQPSDMFDGNVDTVMRSGGINPMEIELIFPAPRAINGLGLTVALTEFRVTLTATRADGSTEVATQTFSGMPPDPTVDVPFAAPVADATGLTIQIEDLNPGTDRFLHVRDLALR